MKELGARGPQGAPRALCADQQNLKLFCTASGTWPYRPHTSIVSTKQQEVPVTALTDRLPRPRVPKLQGPSQALLV